MDMKIGVKKLVSLFLVLSLVVSLMLGCAAQATTQATTTVATTASANATTTAATATTAATTTAAKDLPKLRIALQPYLLAIPTFYMIENGIDVANGFKIESSVYVNGTLINEALGASLWDLATGGTSAVYGIANFDAKVIGNLDLASGGIGAYVRADSPIAKIKDELGKGLYGNAATLKKAKVLVPVGTLNQLNVLKWLEKAGLKSEDVEFVHMDNASAFQAFKAGQGDITAFSPPLTYNATAEGWINGASGEALGLNIWDPLLANPKTLDANMDVIVKYVREMYKVHDKFKADPELAATWSVKWQAKNGKTLTIENARLEVASRPFVTSDQAKTMPVGDTILEMAEFFNKTGSLEAAGLSKVKPNLLKTVIDKVFK